MIIKEKQKLNTFLFDLDGTLLSLTHDEFIGRYFGLMGKKFGLLGFNSQVFINAVLAGTMAMIKNDGTMTNEQAFWKVFNNLVKYEGTNLIEEFEQFYQKDFDLVQSVTHQDEMAIKCISLLKEKGYTLVLATNPLFPAIATQKRTKWAGLDPDDFVYVSTYENSSYSKPSRGYYEGVLKNINKEPGECIMVGNDVKDDMCALKYGLEGFLITSHMINSEDTDLSNYRKGSFTDLYNFIEGLPDLK